MELCNEMTNGGYPKGYKSTLSRYTAQIRKDETKNNGVMPTPICSSEVGIRQLESQEV